MYRLADYLPILDWGRRYSRATLTNDMVAAIIVTIMLIPQSLAYAMLAGLPAEIGLTRVEPTDRVSVNGLGGLDTVDTTGLLPDTVQFQFNQ